MCVCRFNSEIPQAPLIFSDQFLQMSTATGSGLIYGLGEHQNPFLINSTWKQFSFWARDVFPMVSIYLYFTICIRFKTKGFEICAVVSNCGQVCLCYIAPGYLAVDSGGYLCMNVHHALIVAWLNTFQIS